jgi:hypothetical protein
MKNESNAKIQKYSISSAAFGQEKKIENNNSKIHVQIESNIYHDGNSNQKENTFAKT